MSQPLILLCLTSHFLYPFSWERKVAVEAKRWSSLKPNQGRPSTRKGSRASTELAIRFEGGWLRSKVAGDQGEWSRSWDLSEQGRAARCDAILGLDLEDGRIWLSQLSFAVESKSNRPFFKKSRAALTYIIKNTITCTIILLLAHKYIIHNYIFHSFIHSIKKKEKKKIK